MYNLVGSERPEEAEFYNLQSKERYQTIRGKTQIHLRNNYFFYFELFLNFYVTILHFILKRIMNW